MSCPRKVGFLSPFEEGELVPIELQQELASPSTIPPGSRRLWVPGTPLKGLTVLAANADQAHARPLHAEFLESAGAWRWPSRLELQLIMCLPPFHSAERLGRALCANALPGPMTLRGIWLLQGATGSCACCLASAQQQLIGTALKRMQWQQCVFPRRLRTGSLVECETNYHVLCCIEQFVSYT